MDLIALEVLSDSNIEGVRGIQRVDISEAFVDSADTIIKLNTVLTIIARDTHTQLNGWMNASA